MVSSVSDSYDSRYRACDDSGYAMDAVTCGVDRTAPPGTLNAKGLLPTPVLPIQKVRGLAEDSSHLEADEASAAVDSERAARTIPRDGRRKESACVFSTLRSDSPLPLQIPVERDVSHEIAIEAEDRNKSTVMLRNIPNRHSVKSLKNIIDSAGFQGAIDFLYVPMDVRNLCNVGYAFINFRHNIEARRFKVVFDGVRLPAVNSHKVCEVAWARVQGFEANVEHYRNSPIADEFKPTLFDEQGEELPFPGPTQGSRDIPRSMSSRSRRGHDGPPVKVFVGGLSRLTTDAVLREYFSGYGAVREASVIIDRLSGKSRGFGFVSFEREIPSGVLGDHHLIDGVEASVRPYSDLHAHVGKRDLQDAGSPKNDESLRMDDHPSPPPSTHSSPASVMSQLGVVQRALSLHPEIRPYVASMLFDPSAPPQGSFLYPSPCVQMIPVQMGYAPPPQPMGYPTSAPGFPPSVGSYPSPPYTIPQWVQPGSTSWYSGIGQDGVMHQ